MSSILLDCIVKGIEDIGVAAIANRVVDDVRVGRNAASPFQIQIGFGLITGGMDQRSRVRHKLDRWVIH